MPVRLHRCSNIWLKLDGHPCWKVQKALDEAQISYEVVEGPLRRGNGRIDEKRSSASTAR